MRKFALLAIAAALFCTPTLAGDKTYQRAQSGNVANANAVATLSGVTLKSTFLQEVIIKANGATGAACVQLAITGADQGTINWNYCVGAGATTPQLPDIVIFPDLGLRATNGGNIVVTLPALGTGNTSASVTALGYTQ